MKQNAHPIDVLVGQKIKEARLEKGISQKKLAQFLGVTPQQIQKYEACDNRVSVGRLSDISSHLKVPISYFFELEDMSYLQDKELCKLIRYWAKIKPDQRRMLYTIATDLESHV